MSKPKEFKRAKMVSWYDPLQLLNTAKRTVVSTIISENADPRLVAASFGHQEPFDYTEELTNTSEGTEKQKRKEIWIDYVADVGDGWNSTYSVAYSLAKPNIPVTYEYTPTENAKPKKESKTLKRGNILVFGGDEVYPTPTKEEYEKRLITPYKMAFKTHEKANEDESKRVGINDEPHVFAIPGNHDWYDSLVAFRNIFCTDIFNKRIFAGGWRTRQKRSYFALKLPHKWWLLGVDLQLHHDIDIRQLDYFRNIEKEMEPEDKIVLCVPEPYWVKSIKHKKNTDRFKKKEQSIEKLENIFKKCKIKLYLAGDLHHYRRFESAKGNEDSKVNKITAGGGGAFLHPTHDFDFEKNEKKKIPPEFLLKKSYPSFEESKKQDWKNLFLFIWNNKTFGILTALVYFILAGVIKGKIEGSFSLGNAIFATFSHVIDEPLAAIIILLLVAGLVFFTDSNDKWYRVIAGTIHGLFHLGAIFILGWLGYFLSLKVAPYAFSALEWLGYSPYHQVIKGVMSIITGVSKSDYFVFVWAVCVFLVCSVGGFIVGPFIMGLYLFVSLHWFGRHDNEAFSALKIEDYKNFLRIHICKEGNLTIYPMKIDKVSKEWNPENIHENDKPIPKKEFKPELIENPIKIN